MTSDIHTCTNSMSLETVDLYIEIDGALVDKHDTDKVNMPNTINYVNALITAASSVYEVSCIWTYEHIFESLMNPNLSVAHHYIYRERLIHIFMSFTSRRPTIMTSRPPQLGHLMS